MMKLNRGFQLILILIIILTMTGLAGCGGGPGNNNDDKIVDDPEEADDGPDRNSSAENKVYIDKYESIRTEEELKQELMQLVGADQAGEIIYPESTRIKYPFVPLKKDGRLIGYGSWVRQIIYQHGEDMIAVVSPDISIIKWKPLDAGDYHQKLLDETYLKKYYGMTLATPFNPETDVITGSTISSNTYFFEMRNILTVYKKYGPGKE